MKFTLLPPLMAVFALIWLGVGAHQALAGESIVNSEVSVEVTGRDADDARTQAMAKAELDGLKYLLNKLAPAGRASDILALLDARKISKIAKGTEVLEEKVSGNHYQARLLVSFDADELSKLITKASGPSAEEAPSIVNSFLIIPAYQDDSGTVLWEDENPWLKVWKNAGLEATSGDIIAPFGDEKDSSAINIKNMMSIPYSALVQMATRYGASDIVILNAKLTLQPEMTLSVIKRRIARGRSEVNLFNYRADQQESREMLMVRAAHDIMANLQHKKSEELTAVRTIRGGDHNKIMVLANISTLASWTSLRAKLSAMPMIDHIELLAMSSQQVDMVIHYRGDPDALTRAIDLQHIRLVQNKDYWVISRD